MDRDRLMELDERRIAAIVTEVVRNLHAASPAPRPDGGSGGIFATVDGAIQAAAHAQRQLAAMGRTRREQLIGAVREAALPKRGIPCP